MSDMNGKNADSNGLDSALVGRQLRVWRAELGLTQADVAAKIGVSAQQFQKYESGVTKIELSRLFSICNAMNKSPSQLLEKTHNAGTAPDPVEYPEGAAFAQMSETESIVPHLDLSYSVSEVVRLFMEIKSDEDRRAVMFMLQSYARRHNEDA